MGKYDEAISFYEKSLKMRGNIYGNNNVVHPDIAGSYSNIGYCYVKKGNKDLALFNYERCLGMLL